MIFEVEISIQTDIENKDFSKLAIRKALKVEFGEDSISIDRIREV